MSWNTGGYNPNTANNGAGGFNTFQPQGNSCSIIPKISLIQ